MGRKHNPSEINLNIGQISSFSNDKFDGFKIEWDLDIGFGEYTIYISNESGEIYADSECMDNNDDKSFLMELFKLITDKIDVLD